MTVRTYGLGVEPNGITTQSLPLPSMSQTLSDPFDNTNLFQVPVPQEGLGNMWDWGQSSLPGNNLTPDVLSAVYGNITPTEGGGSSWWDAFKGFGADINEMPMTSKLAGMGQLAQGLASIYGAYTNGRQAEKQFDYQKKTAEREWESNKQLTNADLADRQAARVAANSSFESVDSYMSKYGVK